MKLPSISTAVTAVSIAIFVFDRWAWRWFGGWLGRPVIDGTWRGKLVSSYEDPHTHERVPPIDVVAVVTQTYSSVILRQMTAESHSVTKPAALVIDDDMRATLAGVYLNTPNAGVRDRSEMHAGALRLIVEGDPATGLNGSYWTERKTIGELKLEFVSRKKAHTFDEGMKMPNGT